MKNKKHTQNKKIIHKEGRKAHFLLDEFLARKDRDNSIGELLKLQSQKNFEKFDHYNPTAPMPFADAEHIAVRIEPKLDEFDSQIAFFKYSDGAWTAVQESPVLRGQDPFYCGMIQDRHVIGHVEILDIKKSYRTVFYAYKNSVAEIDTLKPLAIGPEGMKDIRLVELPDKRVGIYTRPQLPDFGGLGRIGYFEIDNLLDLGESLDSYMQKKDHKTLLEDLCHEDEWVGANAVAVLADGQHGVLAHIAHKEESEGVVQKEYYGMTFKHNPKTGEISNQKIIATAGNFPQVDPKRDDLDNVIFPGGMKFKENGNIELFVGLKDSHAGRIEIANPWE